MYLILTHDVDWPIHGPGKRHILARKDRFSYEIIRRVLEEDYNPYYGIPDIMDYEERIGVKSTFFFRPWFDDGSSIDCYVDVIKDLIRGGWEIGLHVNSINNVVNEKNYIEEILGIKVYGCRVHYLRMKREYYPIFRLIGLKYDSSLIFSKNSLDIRNTGYLKINGVVIFPVTFMDAYLFTYMKLSENQVIPYIDKALTIFNHLGVKFVTLLWHDNSIRMIGGRIYFKLLDYLASKDYIEIVRGIDAYKKTLESEI